MRYVITLYLFYITHRNYKDVINVHVVVLTYFWSACTQNRQYSRFFRRAREESGTETILNVCNMERSLVGRKHVYTL